MRDVTADPSAAHELMAKYRSRSTPTLIVDEEVMIGFNPGRLDQMLAK